MGRTDMKWKKYSFETYTGMEDIISATLDEIGIEGIEIEDKVPLSDEDTKGMFIDILPDRGEDDGRAVISFYIDPDKDDPGARLEDVRAALDELRDWSDIGRCEISESETEDKDWINNWKEFFKPFTIGDILIKPTWEEIPEEHKDKLLIQIDPGTAFGTGSHETTKLCIIQLQKYISQLRKEAPGAHIEVLDVGTGSGILGIAAVKLGADHVFATDLDDNAITAVIENLAVNDITQEQFEVICGNIIDDVSVQDEAGYEKYDIAVANILAPVIIMLSGEVARHMKKGAVLITSGIIDTKEQDVRAAFDASPDFEILDVEHLGEWVSVIVRKK